MPQCNETEFNTPSESKFIADQNGTFIFSIGLPCAKLYELLNANNTQVDLDHTQYL